MRMHVLDTETVGLAPFEHGGGICEISVREIDSEFNELAHHYSLIDPQGPISAGASGVHGIRDADVVDAPTMQEWLDLVLPTNIWSADQDPIWFFAHNAKFDWKFLDPYIKCGVKLVDTLMLARRYYPDAENHKLTTLAVIHNLDSFSAKDAHGAGQDTAVLLSFVKQLCEDSGLTLEELAEDSQRKEPILKFTFGKCKGKLIAEVKRNDPKYIKWMLTDMKGLDPEVREAILAA